MASSVPGRSATGNSPGVRVAVPLLVGAAVSVAVGAYGGAHVPTGRSVTTFGFSSVLTMKVWLTTAAAALALVQLGTALRIFGHLGTGTTPRWVSVLHRASGSVAVLLTLPVAFHCLWALGYSTLDTRTTLHSLLGCTFYGAFVAKMLSLKMRRLPGWALPVFGGLVFATLVAIWLTSSLWYFGTVGVDF
jgi:heme/copper-type cytochrome/quinol oxidase subunit 4